MRVLLVEDDPSLAEHISGVLAKDNVIVTHVDDGRKAGMVLSDAARESLHFDAVLLDLTLPGMDGMDVLRGMRNAGDATPVLVITARSALQDKIQGFNIGADDYLAKPFEVEELLARVRAVARRRAAAAPALVKTVNNLSFDSASGVFSVNGAMLVLPKRQSVILEALVKRKGTIVPKDFFMKLDLEGASSGSVDNQISRLRKKLSDAGASAVIKTIHGIGYSIEDQSD